MSRLLKTLAIFLVGNNESISSVFLVGNNESSSVGIPMGKIHIICLFEIGLLLDYSFCGI